MESELNLDVRFGGPNFVNRPLRGYRVVECPNVDVTGCLPPHQYSPTTRRWEEESYDEDFQPGVFFSSTEANDMALTLRLNPEFTSRWPRTVRPA